ncbi:MAG: HD-GYP domain-containing protein [Gammaproteobacteria bacterium]
MTKQIGELEQYPVRVLVVDDEPQQRALESHILDDPVYEVVEAACGRDAITAIRQQEFDVVVLDRHMPGMDGDEVCRRIRDEEGMRFLPVILVTGDDPATVLTHSLNGYANDYIKKPYSADELIARVNSAAILKRRTDQLENIEVILFALARMVEAKDGNTGDHCSRLVHVCTVFGKSLGLTEHEILTLGRGGILHDIGKLGVPDRILLKPGPLDDDEWPIMRRHTVIGYELCKGMKTLKTTLPIIRHHHEKYDGSGYPDGLAGSDIPFLARVFQIADIYDALAFPRAYKPGLPAAEIIAVMQVEATRGWRDPELVSRFIHIVRDRPDELAMTADRNNTPGSRMLDKIMPVEATEQTHCHPGPIHG